TPRAPPPQIAVKQSRDGPSTSICSEGHGERSGPHRFDGLIELFPRQLGIHRKRETPRGPSLGHRERALAIAETSIGFLEMNRDGVMKAGLDAPLGQMLPETVPILGANDVEVINVIPIGLDARKLKVGLRESRRIVRCTRASRVVPFIEVP